jgi:hypothetical protein
MDMRYHLVTDRVRQKQFDGYWRPGRENLGDYHTKHHSAQHNKDKRGLILHGQILKKSPALSGGGLGMLNIKLVRLELINELHLG